MEKKKLKIAPFLKPFIFASNIFSDYCTISGIIIPKYIYVKIFFLFNFLNRLEMRHRLNRGIQSDPLELLG